MTFECARHGHVTENLHAQSQREMGRVKERERASASESGMQNFCDVMKTSEMYAMEMHFGGGGQANQNQLKCTQLYCTTQYTLCALPPIPLLGNTTATCTNNNANVCLSFLFIYLKFLQPALHTQSKQAAGRGRGYRRGCLYTCLASELNYAY